MATFVGSDPIAFRWEGPKVVAAQRRATIATLHHIGRMGKEEAQLFAHVASGRMRDHVFYEVDISPTGTMLLVLGDDAESEGGFPYPAVEETTPGHEFLRPAADVILPLVPGELAASARREGF